MNNMPPIKMVVGLGNPGPQYANSRHNIGFMVLGALAAQLGFSIDKKKFNCLWAEYRLGGRKIIFTLPQTYMNLSGQAVYAMADYFDIEAQAIAVVYDDLDLSLGRLKISVNRGAGGHKGLSSIMDYLDGGEFARLRVGIGRPRFNEPVERYVLANFYPDEQEELGKVLESACNGLLALLEEGVNAAMQKYNRI